MQNRHRLFKKKDNNFLSISYDKFIDAIRKGNTEMIDTILAAKESGYELDIDHEVYGKTPLEILLEKRDFINAAKLIKAGAKTEIMYEAWAGGHGDNYETRCRSAFDVVKLTKDDLLKLAEIQAMHKDEATYDEKVITLRK